jgi:hypothetical protein
VIWVFVECMSFKLYLLLGKRWWRLYVEYGVCGLRFSLLVIDWMAVVRRQCGGNICMVAIDLMIAW